MNATATLFDAGDIIAKPRREAAPVKVTVTDDGLFAGVRGEGLDGGGVSIHR